jgi:hypothetical protein
MQLGCALSVPVFHYSLFVNVFLLLAEGGGGGWG